MFSERKKVTDKQKLETFYHQIERANQEKIRKKSKKYSYDFINDVIINTEKQIKFLDNSQINPVTSRNNLSESDRTKIFGLDFTPMSTTNRNVFTEILKLKVRNFKGN